MLANFNALIGVVVWVWASCVTRGDPARSQLLYSMAACSLALAAYLKAGERA